jgi:hypothetical protein
MANITINTERELLKFLKVVAEESYKSLNEVLDDPAVKNYNAAKKQDEKNLGDIKSEADEPTGEQQKDAGSPAEPEEEKSAQQKEKSTGEDFAGSFQDLLDAINDLRSGKSVKDDEIKSELSSYYERLTEDEQTVLYTFLLELSKILTGAIDGDDAQDPSDPPLNFSVKKDDDPKPKEPAQQKKKVAQKKGTEDTSPPEESLPISESSNDEALRNKVRLLMSR